MGRFSPLPPRGAITHLICHELTKRHRDAPHAAVLRCRKPKMSSVAVPLIVSGARLGCHAVARRAAAAAQRICVQEVEVQAGPCVVSKRAQGIAEACISLAVEWIAQVRMTPPVQLLHMCGCT